MDNADNVETAITQLALGSESFDKDCVNSESWQGFFIDRYIQNTRLSFDYLDMLCDQNDGQISVEELNYIQYSLTNTELDFSSYVDGSIDRYDASSIHTVVLMDIVCLLFRIRGRLWNT